MTRASLKRLYGDELGGSMVEFAVATLVMVPVVLYGIWFSDALHFATVAEEASIEPAFDATAKLVHDYDGAGSPAGKLSGAASKSQSDVLAELSTSFDAFDTGADPISASVIARPSNLTLKCQRSGGSGQAPGAGVPFIANKVGGKTVSLLNEDSWVTCSSKVEIDTPMDKLPTHFEQEHANENLFDDSHRAFSLCGAGQGITGCGTGGANVGFSILLDDWALEDGKVNQLSIGSSGGNNGYFNVGNQFFVNAGSGAIIMAMGAVTMIPQDLGATANFRLTYQVTGSGAYSQTESGHGQSGPLGGPKSPHTGGPWHDEHGPHSNMHSTVFGMRANDHYLARPDYPAD